MKLHVSLIAMFVREEVDSEDVFACESVCRQNSTFAKETLQIKKASSMKWACYQPVDDLRGSPDLH